MCSSLDTSSDISSAAGTSLLLIDPVNAFPPPIPRNGMLGAGCPGASLLSRDCKFFSRILKMPRGGLGSGHLAVPGGGQRRRGSKCVPASGC